nr:MAG TPA: hypothetical protein [Caudoviricetes sp.]
MVLQIYRLYFLQKNILGIIFYKIYEVYRACGSVKPDSNLG